MIINEIMEAQIRKIFRNFGLKNQIEKLKEELKELLVELERGKIDRDTILEMADVIILILQLTLHKRIQLLRAITFKLERTIERIKEKYYEK